MNICNITIFFILTFYYILSICYIIFYTIALVRNCVWLYSLKRCLKSNNITNLQYANELRIDTILLILNRKGIVDSDEFMDIFKTLINQSSIENPNEILSYIEKRYGYPTNKNEK